MDKMFGAILVLDAFLSLFLPQDKQFMWQLGRVIRLIIGLYFLFN